MTGTPRLRTGIIGFILLYIGFGISYVDRAAISIALSQIGKDFHLSAADLGIVISIFFFGYAAMQIPGGWLSDRFGSRWVVIATIALWSVFTMATSYAWSFTSLLVIRFLFGLAEGGFPAASVKGIGELFRAESRPKLASLLISSNYAGSIVAPLIMAPLMISLGWRHAFEAIGAGGIIFAVIYFFVIPNTAVKASKSEPVKPVAAASSVRARDLLTSPFMWQMVVVWFGVSCVNKGLDSWMPLYLLQVRGLDLKTVGFLTPIPFVMATIASAAGGWIMTKFFHDREKYMLVGASVLTAIFLYFMATSTNIAMLIVYQAIVYFFKSFVFACVIAFPTKVLKPAQLGLGIGIINFGGQSAGFVAPAVIGFIVTGTGSFDAAFFSLVGACLLAAVVAMTIRTTPQVSPVPVAARV